MEHRESSDASKPLEWIGDSWEALVAFPQAVRKAMGYALFLAQIGQKAPSAKALKGFGGSGVVEIVKDYDGNTFRTVYTVRFANAVYVLHAFQKKSKRGGKTSHSDIALIRQRLKAAAMHHETHYRGNQ